jgi:hypothetical protein
MTFFETYVVPAGAITGLLLAGLELLRSIRSRPRLQVSDVRIRPDPGAPHVYVSFGDGDAPPTFHVLEVKVKNVGTAPAHLVYLGWEEDRKSIPHGERVVGVGRSLGDPWLKTILPGDAEGFQLEVHGEQEGQAHRAAFELWAIGQRWATAGSLLYLHFKGQEISLSSPVSLHPTAIRSRWTLLRAKLRGGKSYATQTNQPPLRKVADARIRQFGRQKRPG